MSPASREHGGPGSSGGSAGAGPAGGSPAGGSPATEGGGGQGSDLDELRAAAKALTTDLPGPLARIRLSRGEATLEVEWQTPPAPVVVAAPMAGHTPGLGGVSTAPASAGAQVGGGAQVGVPGGEADAGGAGSAYGMGVGPALSIVPDLPRGTPVEAPLVGTFYRSATPDAAPFVEIGDRVEAGQQVAILEAMKLLNSIEAPVSGEVADIVVGDGEMVEFGQVLLYIKEG